MEKGLIPAWAGKTTSTHPALSPHPAHPRVGGENLWTLTHGRFGWGSSPRGRGKLPRVVRAVGYSRLIPAWAGKTSNEVIGSPVLRAHPRVGGENPGTYAAVGAVPGSSPRGRGKLVAPRTDLLREGLIPAWAGKTASAHATTLLTQAHPRVGGENLKLASTPLPDPGSSPRGRGKLEVRLLGRRGLGLIPAWAGKTLCFQPSALLGGAHPRVGGENRGLEAVCPILEGSSPRGRGKLGLGIKLTNDTGLIPAWAGKTVGWFFFVVWLGLIPAWAGKTHTKTHGRR